MLALAPFVIDDAFFNDTLADGKKPAKLIAIANRVVLATGRTRLTPGGKAWVLWTHLGNENCVKELERIRWRARSWQVVHEGPGRGLALAEF